MTRSRAGGRKPVFSSGGLLRWTAGLVLLWVALTTMPVLALRWVDPPTSAFMVRERVLAWRAGETSRPAHTWVPWDELPWQMKVAALAAEDQKFATHRGFDLDSIKSALDERRRGRRLRGASTISQQVAKNLFLWPQSTWPRKALEAYFTVLIETLWPKRRILEVYLNIAEFGSGIYGTGAASERFFGKPAARLTAHEAALLAAVLPSPKRLRADAPSPYVRSRQRWILAQMTQLGGEQALAPLR